MQLASASRHPPAPWVLPRACRHAGNSHPDVRRKVAHGQSLDNKWKSSARAGKAMSMTAPEVAAALGVSRQRISELTRNGKLDGCWQGEGRARRYDLVKVAERLNKVLDRGQMMGNGAATKGAIREILGQAPDRSRPSEDRRQLAPATVGDSGPAVPSDSDRYDLARAQKVEEEARRLRRQNQEAEGTYVLASAVASSTARLVAQEVAEFESVLRNAARRVADQLGVDFKLARKILLEEWRSHRQLRSRDVGLHADAAEPTDEEREADI